MTKKTYKILSTLYGMISEHNAEEFLEACNHEGVSINLRLALKKLAEESESIENNEFIDVPLNEYESQKKKKAGVKNKKTHQYSPSNLSPDLEHSQYLKNLVEFLCDPKKFPSKSELQKLALKTNLLIEVDPRVSRQRTARKIAAEGAKSDLFKRKLFEIIQDDASKQTEGWLDIIRKN